MVDSSGGGGGITGVGGYCCGLNAPETVVRQEASHTGIAALMFSGAAQGGSADYAYTKAFDLSSAPITVGATTTLTYWIYPQGDDSTSPYVSGGNSTCVSLDLVFNDGTALRNKAVLDETATR